MRGARRPPWRRIAVFPVEAGIHPFPRVLYSTRFPGASGRRADRPIIRRKRAQSASTPAGAGLSVGSAEMSEMRKAKPEPPSTHLINSADPEKEPSAIAEVGRKGAALMELALLGAPVPAGFILPTSLCSHAGKAGGEPSAELAATVDEGLAQLAHLAGRGFADDADPLLVSVRGSTPAKMPVEPPCIVNLGLTEKGVKGLIGKSGDARLAWDAYRRFLHGYGNHVLGISTEGFAAARQELPAAAGADFRISTIFHTRNVPDRSGGRLDLLVNNAGIFAAGALKDMELGEIQRLIDVNLMGVIHGILIIGILMGLMIILLGCLGLFLGLSWPWYLAVFFALVLFARQLFSVRKRDRDACFRAFLNNNWVGLVIVLGFLGHFLLAGAYAI